MDYVDLTQAALDALQSSPSSATTVESQREAHRLRGRILGVLIRRGRLTAQLTVDDCAAFLQLAPQQIEDWELGESAPSLPQLEGLTRCLLATAAGEPVDSARFSAAGGGEYYVLRKRMIAAQLKMARQRQELAVEEVGRRSSLASELIERYEFGELMIPLTHLCVLAQAVRMELRNFSDVDGAGSAHCKREPEAAPEPAVDTELARFATDARNQAFIRLAMAFRQIDREDLHRIAEAMYSIINEKRDANGRSAATQ